MNMIKVQGLQKNIKGKAILKDISFEVAEGECVALIGPNGAGKTTLLDCLLGDKLVTRGQVSIQGLPVTSSKLDYTRSYLPQENIIVQKLKVKELIAFFQSIYPNPLSNQEIDQLLQFDQQQKDQFAEKLSGGQKRRVDIARALLSQPDILFLDEPTTGLDIQTRKSIWDLLYRLQKDEGMTIVLTTHYLDEADEADQIYIVDHGKVIAQGSATAIKSQYASNILKKWLQTEMTVEAENELEYLFYPRTSQEAIEYLAQVREEIDSFEFRPGTMDDAFIALTGREVR